MNPTKYIHLGIIHGFTSCDPEHHRMVNGMPHICTKTRNNYPNLNNHPPMKPITTMPYKLFIVDSRIYGRVSIIMNLQMDAIYPIRQTINRDLHEID